MNERAKKLYLSPSEQLFERMQAQNVYLDQHLPQEAKDILKPYQITDSTQTIDQNQLEMENHTLRSMAQTFIPFNMTDFNLKALDPTQVAASFTAETNPLTAHNLEQIHSSSSIKEAAATQALTPKEQVEASLFRPDNEMRENYLRAKYQMYMNEQIKHQLAGKIMSAQENMEQLKERQNYLKEEANVKSKKYQSDVTPNKYFDLIQMEKRISQKVDAAAAIAKRINKFDPTSRNISNYNEELQMQHQTLKSEAEKTDKTLNLEQVKFITSQMKINNVKPDVETHAHMFNIALEAGNIQEANLYLKKVYEHSKVNAFSPITTDQLNSFYNKSIARDNFEGLAYLINYLETQNISIASWDIGKFRSSIDFYLNHSFDLNKIFTFTRFYTHFANCKLESLQGKKLNA